MKKSALLLVTTVSVLVAGTSHAQTPPTFVAALSPDTIGPGSVTTLTLTITNDPTSAPVQNVAFSAALPAGVTIASPANANTSCANGRVVAPDGGTMFSLQSARVGTGVRCTVRLNVSAVVGTAPHVLTTGDLTSSAGNSGAATTTLTVDVGRPGFRKSFSPSTVAPGQISTLTLVIDNTANPSAISNFSFTDRLPTGMTIAASANLSTTCTFANVTATPGSDSVQFNGAQLAAMSQCEVVVDVSTAGAGTFGNTTSDLVVGFQSENSGKAAAVLLVDARPVGLDFVDDPGVPGGTIRMRVTLRNLDRASAASNITFTNDLGSTLTGLTAVRLPVDPCGVGSSLTGASIVTLTGGTLPASGRCSFTVDLMVPASATPGTYPSSLGPVTAEVGGQTVDWGTATDALRIEVSTLLTTSFVDDPVASATDVTLEYTLTNTSPNFAATDISFDDDFGSFIPQVVVSMSPAPGFCGAGATMTVQPASQFASAFIRVTGASLAAGASCTFMVSLTIPLGTPGGTYVERTSPVSSTIDSRTTVGPPGSDSVVVVAAPMLSKRFIGSPAAPGAMVTVEYSLSYDENAPGDATNIRFNDDLDQVIPGLVAVSLPRSDVCGAGSSLTGTSSIAFSGGSLSIDSSCTFTVDLAVPATALPGSRPSTTSNITATSLGLAVSEQGASTPLVVSGFDFSKSFVGDPVLAGGTVVLEFTLRNDASTLATQLSFQDDLSSTLRNLVTTGGAMTDVCGAGSQLIVAGARISLINGSLDPNTSCTFSVPLQVPVGAAPGDYVNRTTPLSGSIDGNAVNIPAAVDTLTIVDPITLTKAFLGDPVAPGDVVQLEFTITNNNPTEAATAVAFDDDIAMVAPLVAVGLPLTDVCGAGSMISGTSLLSFTGGSLPAGATCSFVVEIQVPNEIDARTTLTNVTTEVTATIGGVAVRGPPALDTLAVELFDFTKAFTSSTTPGGTVTLVYRIEDRGTTDGATGLAFTDDLDAALGGLVASSVAAMGVCGERSTLRGTSEVELTGGVVGRAGVCSFEVILQVPMTAAAGSYVSTTSTLTAAGRPMASSAVATLLVEPPPVPVFTKTFDPAVITVGEVTTLSFTIDNVASTADARDVQMTDNLPTGLVVADPSGVASSCGGTVTGEPGQAVVRFTNDVVAAASACVVRVDVTANEAGTYTNTTEPLMSSAGSSGTANAMLEVRAVVARDGGVDRDAGVVVGVDGGKPPPEEDGGCGCHTGASTESSPLVWLLGLVSLLRRPRRTRRRRDRTF